MLPDAPSVRRELAASADVTARRVQPAHPLNYARHFVLLSCVAAALAATSPWRPLHGAVASFALYGALHSSVVVLSLRIPQSLRRNLLFIAIAVGLSMLSVAGSLYGGRLIGTLPGLLSPFLLLTLSAGFGAASYAVLIREFRIADLSFRAVVAITLGCVLVTLAVLASGIFLKTVGGLWFAVGWWFAFSAGLWYQEAI